jgi:hypothetical protein
MICGFLQLLGYLLLVFIHVQFIKNYTCYQALKKKIASEFYCMRGFNTIGLANFIVDWKNKMMILPFSNKTIGLAN